MNWLLGPDADLDTQARRYLYEMTKRAELRWHPLVRSLPVEGIELLRDAERQRRGVILHFLHHGQYDGLFPSVRRHGFRVHVLAHEHFYYEKVHPFLQQHLRNVSYGAQPSDVFEAKRGAFREICARLSSGSVVAIASDLPGLLNVMFLGQRVGMASGAARAALRTGALIVPVTAHPGPGWATTTFRMQQSVDPRGFTDPARILQVILACHDKALQAWASGIEDPLLRSGAPTDLEGTA